MEYVEGGDLAQHIEKIRMGNTTIGQASVSQIDENTLLKWFSQLVQALVSVHCKGLIHRDLKPANLLLTLDGDLKIGDFGISKHHVWRRASNNSRLGRGEVNLPLAQARSKVGTPFYMAP